MAEKYASQKGQAVSVGKPSKRWTGLLCLLAVCMMLIACENPSQVEMNATEKEQHQTMTLLQTQSQGCEYQVIESEYTLDNGYCITNFQVCGMEDGELEDRVNESLNHYLYILDKPWFDETTTRQMPNIIHYQSERYLSVEYGFMYDNQHIGRCWHFCVTVDMQTGEVVCLDDLIDLNEEFGKLVVNGNILRSTGTILYYNREDELIERDDVWTTAEEATEGNNWSFRDQSERFQNYDVSWWFDYYTREYLYGDYLAEQYHEDAIVYYESMYHRTFYLEEGKIRLLDCFQSGGNDIHFWSDYIVVDDVQEHLKVPKW